MRHSRALCYGIARAWNALRRRPISVVAATGLVAVAFLLVGAAYLLERTVSAASSTWDGAHMVVYLEEGTPPEHAERIRAVLADLPAVERSVYISPGMAMERLHEALGEHGELVQGLEPTMAPASIEVNLRTGVGDVAATYPVVERLEATAGVEDVEFAGEWVDGVSGLLAGLRHAGWIAILLAGGACVYIVTIFMAARFEARRPEAEVMHLLGASGAFVRGPLVLEGALQGAAGAGLAILGLWLLFRASADTVSRVLREAFGAVPLSFLPLEQLALFIAAGAALGAACSWLATRRHALC